MVGGNDGRGSNGTLSGIGGTGVGGGRGFSGTKRRRGGGDDDSSEGREISSLGTAIRKQQDDMAQKVVRYIPAHLVFVLKRL